MAEMVLHAVLLEPTWFLKATDKRFLSSTVRFCPFSLTTGTRNSTMSSYLSAYSATLPMKILSSILILNSNYKE
jgi:hypothetical protein